MLTAMTADIQPGVGLVFFPGDIAGADHDPLGEATRAGLLQGELTFGADLWLVAQMCSGPSGT